MAKVQTTTTVEPEIATRLRIVALVDRRSIADVVSSCIERALPELEDELCRPRLAASVLAALRAGTDPAEILAQVQATADPSALKPFALNDSNDPAAPPVKPTTPEQRAYSKTKRKAA